MRTANAIIERQKDRPMPSKNIVICKSIRICNQIQIADIYILIGKRPEGFANKLIYCVSYLTFSLTIDAWVIFTSVTFTCICNGIS